MKWVILGVAAAAIVASFLLGDEDAAVGGAGGASGVSSTTASPFVCPSVLALRIISSISARGTCNSATSSGIVTWPWVSTMFKMRFCCCT